LFEKNCNSVSSDDGREGREEDKADAEKSYDLAT